MYIEQVYKQTNKQWKIKITSSSGILKTIYLNGSFYCYLERENYKVLKFHRSNSSYFRISTTS